MKVNQGSLLGHSILYLEGRLDTAAVTQYRDQLLSEAETADKLLLNFSGVDYVDSSGLGLIVSMIKRIRENNGELAVCNLSAQVQTLFELTRLTQIMTIYETEEIALAA